MDAKEFEGIDKTNGEQNSVFLQESHYVGSFVEIVDTEIDPSAVGTEANNQQCMEIPQCLDEKRERKTQGLFAPFSHHMRPDLEYIRLESEKSASDQEAATKLINDRYKLIMEHSARRKEKEQKDKIRFSQLSHNVDHDEVMKITQLSVYADNEDIKGTTQMLHNMHLAPGFLAKDKSGEFSENEDENIHLYSGLDKFIILDFNEINMLIDTPIINMPKTVTEDYEYIMEDSLVYMSNEQKDGEKEVSSQKPGSAKCKEASQIFCDENEFIGSSFEELLCETSESLFEI